MKTTASIPDLVVERTSPAMLVARVSGNWRERPALPGVEFVRQALREEPPVRSLEFDTSGLTGWDSRFVAFISQCAGIVRAFNIEVRYDGLPEGVRRLLRLAHAMPEKADSHRAAVKASFFRKVGERTIQGWEGTLGLFTFLGQNMTAVGNLFRGRAQFRWADAILVMEQTGPQALGIVAMINFLVGLILAFVGALELARFGASIYVADLVGIATVREMGCIMTGIILCGRTGAAFAAQLGTMKVNEEINALQTFGVSPIEFLVLPRIVALILMMPFLCVFADLISIAGGFCVSSHAGHHLHGIRQPHDPSHSTQEFPARHRQRHLLWLPGGVHRLSPGNAERPYCRRSGTGHHPRGGVRDFRHHCDRWHFCGALQRAATLNPRHEPRRHQD